MHKPQFSMHSGCLCKIVNYYFLNLHIAYVKMFKTTYSVMENVENARRENMIIVKRNGNADTFDITKIIAAITAANKEIDDSFKLESTSIREIAGKVSEHISEGMTVEQIQDMVEDELLNRQAYTLAKTYIKYRYKRDLVRKANSTDRQILELIEAKNEEIKEENSNKNPTVVSVQRDYMAGEVSKDVCRRFLLDERISKAHDEGIIHFHDSDYFAQHMHNCDLVNLEDMLQNGTVISGTLIEKPHSFATACNITTQIIAQVASSQYGGQSITMSHLAPFVDISRKRIRVDVMEEMQVAGIELSEAALLKIVDTRLKEEINRGVQMIQYQIITLMTTNGQAPFVTMFMFLNEVPEGPLRADLAMIIEEMLRQRHRGVKNEKGIYVTPAFPKLIYVLSENNVTKGTPYFYLTELAAVCTAKRMVPDYISEKIMREYKQGDCYTCMGCRSFLTPYRDENNKPKYYGRFNQGVVTINLVDVALSSKGDLEEFWRIFDERLELCYEGLLARHERLKGTKSDVAPILWQYGALARLEKGETIDKLLYNGYSTISLGYAGLYECVKYMTGKSHTHPASEPFAIKVMQTMNDACAKWKKMHNIDFSVYGTPLESTTYKFAKALKDRFGVIEGITDKNYITNSYHVHVTEKIDAFTKLGFEAKFQQLSPGGAISYVEVPNLQNNIDAVLSVMHYIYDNIMYAELNTKSDYCHKCDYDGEMKIINRSDDEEKLVWECPNCGNQDQNHMSVTRRTCGYIGTQFWNQGRTQEIKERVLHL